MTKRKRIEIWIRLRPGGRYPSFAMLRNWPQYLELKDEEVVVRQAYLREGYSGTP